MSKRILITGGAGFIGSHVAEFCAQKGEDVIVYDNLSRAALLGKDDKNTIYNWNYLTRYRSVRLIRGDIRDKSHMEEVARDVDVIIHTAAQTAVTTSMRDPEPDFTVNTIGTFNVLEAARKSGRKPSIVYCSTNKVYGENVNKVPVIEEKTRYRFANHQSSFPDFSNGIPEAFPIDLCEHTPYGCSKLAGDLYMQDYARLYGLKIGVFRMSCIYGTRQFGVEDQGWVAWFTIATILGKPIIIYGDGKQVRDVLYVSDLVSAFDAFLESDLPYGVFNIGGGPGNTLSLLELLEILEELTGKKGSISYSDWRPSDQKVYISDIGKARRELGWSPKTSPRDGIKQLVKWVEENKEIFK